MALGELLMSLYAWADSRSLEIFAGAIGVPVAGTAMAWIGKGGRTDRDGRIIASTFVGFGLLVFLVEVIAIAIAHMAFQRSVMDADVVLLLAPIVCLGGCLLGIRMVFPLNQLASVRSFTEIGVFVVACVAALWFFSKFRGWGIIFWGDLVQLAVIGALGYFLSRRLFERATGRRR